MQDIQREAVEPLCRKVSHCRMCGNSSFEEYLDLGHTPPADQFRKADELDIPEISYPLRVMLCRDCGLSQLTHVVDARVLYQFDYPYESSTTATGKRHWDECASEVVGRLSLKKDSFVVDIGSNVGTLLESFRDLGMKVAGVDPAPNIVQIANEAGVSTICDFFSSKSSQELLGRYGAASVIIGTNVFAHIDDLDSVLEASKELLTPDGAFIFESPYFGYLVTNLEYDTIYHEHLSYLSLAPVEHLALRHGMEVFAVKETDIHGGSFRVYIGHKGAHAIDGSIPELRAREKELKLHDIEALKVFAGRVAQNREDIMRIIEGLHNQGKKIAVVSTPAKGMTLLNYCGFTKKHIAFATEKARLKIGRFTPGAFIPILPDEALVTEKADYALLLAWNFSKEIIANNASFQKQGGKFIIPIPEPIIK